MKVHSYDLYIYIQYVYVYTVTSFPNLAVAEFYHLTGIIAREMQSNICSTSMRLYIFPHVTRCFQISPILYHLLYQSQGGKYVPALNIIH